MFDFDWNQKRTLPSGSELSYTVDTTLMCCYTTQSQLQVWDVQDWQGRREKPSALLCCFSGRWRIQNFKIVSSTWIHLAICPSVILNCWSQLKALGSVCTKQIEMKMFYGFNHSQYLFSSNAVLYLVFRMPMFVDTAESCDIIPASISEKDKCYVMYFQPMKMTKINVLHNIVAYALTITCLNISCSLSSWTWDKTAPMPVLLALLFSINDFDLSG